MTTTTRSYRLLRMIATATTRLADPDAVPGLTVVEQWFDCVSGPEGVVEVPSGDPRPVAHTAPGLDPEWGVWQGDFDPDEPGDELVASGFDRPAKWTRQPDGTYTADVDWHDPTP